MTIVYDKEGKEFKVAHEIDVAEWLVAGYTLEAPEIVEGKKPREILIDRANELELEFANNISNKDLKALIEAKEAE